MNAGENSSPGTNDESSDSKIVQLRPVYTKDETEQHQPFALARENEIRHEEPAHTQGFIVLRIYVETFPFVHAQTKPNFDFDIA